MKEQGNNKNENGFQAFIKMFEPNEIIIYIIAGTLGMPLVGEAL